jgi:hypothetical protein
MANYNWDNPNCPITKMARERNQNFFARDNGIPQIRLENNKGDIIKCSSCQKQRFKLYAKFGGITQDKKGKVVNTVPVKYNFSCACGKMLVIQEGTFSYAKVKYGCGAAKCPKDLKAMNKDCLKCEFIYEK